jgi:hypothetical protein
MMTNEPRDPEQLAATAAADMPDLSGMPTAAESADTAQFAGPRGGRGIDDGVEQLKWLESKAQSYIRRNPLRSAGLAFAAGYLIAVVRRL